MKLTPSQYQSNLQEALKRWLQTERRSLLDIMTEGELSRTEAENACDVDPCDVIAAIGAHARGAFSLSDRSDNGGAF